MRYLHTMLRVRNLDAALDFYCNKLGLKRSAPPGRRQEQVHPRVPAASADDDLVAKGPAPARRRWSS